MTKKVTATIILIALISAMVAALAGCNTVDKQEAVKVLKNALVESENGNNGKIFYWRESFATYREGTSNHVRQTEVNVLCDLDDIYKFIRIAREGEYDYQGLKVHITERDDGKNVYDAYYGGSDDGRDYKAVAANGVDYEYAAEEDAAYNYVESEEFKAKYSLSSRLNLLDELVADDGYYEIESAQKQGNLVTINLKVTSKYRDFYEKKHGDESPLDGKRVLIEVTYGRIANVMTYRDEPTDNGILTMEYESYMLEISYLGPKFDVPRK